MTSFCKRHFLAPVLLSSPLLVSVNTPTLDCSHLLWYFCMDSKFYRHVFNIALPFQDDVSRTSCVPTYDIKECCKYIYKDIYIRYVIYPGCNFVLYGLILLHIWYMFAILRRRIACKTRVLTSRPVSGHTRTYHHYQKSNNWKLAICIENRRMRGCRVTARLIFTTENGHWFVQSIEWTVSLMCTCTRE